MTLWQAIVLGIVEGVTEYLPVSSTGHLVLASWALGLSDPQSKAAVDAFIIAIQGGAILAVLGLYRRRVGRMILGIMGKDPSGARLALNLVVAFAPAAILGPVLNDVIERWLFRPWPVIAALAVGGVVMIVVTPWQRRQERFVELDQLAWRQSLVIGLLQCVAMWPGTSRSMVTIVGGMLVGLRARQAAEFSFLLGLPTLGGACVYRIVKSELSGQVSPMEAFGWGPVIVGFIAATASAALAVTWLVRWLNRHGLAVFGWYRLAIAALFVVLVLSSTDVL